MYQNPLLGSDQWKYNEGLGGTAGTNVTGRSNITGLGNDYDNYINRLLKNPSRYQPPSQASSVGMTYPSSTENIDGLAGTARPNVTGGDYSLSGLMKNQSPSTGNSAAVAATYDNTLFENASQQPTPPPAADPTMWQKFKSGVSNYGKDADGKYSAGGNPLMRDLTAVGGLGLGIASFLEQRKTAGLQRDALRHDIATAKEHRANRQALGDSWNRAWSK